MGYYKVPTRNDLKLVKHYIKYLKRVGVSNGLVKLEQMDLIKYIGSGAEKMVYSIENIDEFVLKIDKSRDEDSGKCRCRLECYIYREAIKEGYEEYFAPTYYLGKIGEVTFSLQNKMNVWEDNTYDALCQYISNNTDDFEYYHNVDEDIEEDYMDYDMAISDMSDLEIVSALFGKTIKGFDNFLDDYNINDLHQGNFGADEYGNFVIIDYCGYRTDSKTPRKW